MSSKTLALLLLAATLLYNSAEGGVALIAALQANSVILLGYGADSYLEVLAAGAVIWRLTRRTDEEGERAEQRAMRVIGATFLALALAVLFQATLALATGEESRRSGLGLAVLCTSMVVMPALSFAKFAVAARGNLPALAAEARETVACAYFTLTALGGVIAMFVLGWWWLDAGAALLMLPWLVREGMEGVRGDACFDGLRPCFCRPCFFGLRDCSPADRCQIACC